MINYILINIGILIFTIYLYKKIKNAIHMLQLNSYRNERYFSWIKNNIRKVIKLKEIVLLAIPIIFIALDKIEVGLILNILIYCLLYISFRIDKQKKPLVSTSRTKRIDTTYIIFLIALVLLSNIYINNIAIYITYYLITILSYFTLILINIINSPTEKLIQRGFYKKAQRKLNDVKDLKVIGITGSYGKTSTKYILNTILSEKYNTLMTPESFNTLMGVVRTVNEKLNAAHQIFICEMGAKNIGDIKEICDLVNPDYAVLTAIGPQHLETFKTIENVSKTKLELIDSLKSGGTAFINYDDENIQKAIIDKNTVKFGLNNNSNFWAENITINEKGSIFDICWENKRISNIKTKLLRRTQYFKYYWSSSCCYRIRIIRRRNKSRNKILKTSTT